MYKMQVFSNQGQPENNNNIFPFVDNACLVLLNVVKLG